MLIIGVVGWGLASHAQEETEAACRAEAEAFHEDYLARRLEGPGARADLLGRLRRLLDRHPDAPVCRLVLRDDEAVLLIYDGAIGAADSVFVASLADPAFRRAPALTQSRLYYNKGYVNERLGRLGDAAQFYYRSVSLSDRMPARQAIRFLVAAASIARELNDPVSDGYLRTAARLLRDSTLAPREESIARADWYLEQARQAQVRGERTWVDPERTAAFRSMRAYADSAYRQVRTESDVEQGGRMTIALIFRAQADARLGETDAARRSLDQARPWLERAQIFYETAPYSWWMARAETDRAAGALDDALVASRQAETAALALQTAPARWLARAATQTGDLHDALGQTAEAEASYREAIALAEVERDRIGLRDWTAASFADQQAPHRALARLLADAGRGWEALVALDATRARTYRDLRASLGARQRLRPDEYAGVERLVDSLAAVRVALAASTEAVDRGTLTSTIGSLQDSIQTRLGIEGVGPSALDRDQIQAALRDGGRVLVTYLLSQDEGLGFVVRSDTFAVVPLAVSIDSVRARGNRLTAGWTRDAPDPSFARGDARRLYDDLIAPLAPLLPRGAPLTIVPDAALAQIPFAALLASDAPGDFLVRHHAVTTDLAVGLIPEAAGARPEVALDVLAAGRSTFAEPGLPDLPFVPDEVRSVAEHGARTRVALDERATEAALLDAVGSARVVHIASHAIADPAIPFNSRIVLADDPDAPDDGVLHLYELQDQPLHADLVVLSGCSTAQGRRYDGEGLIGLHYGVRVAGARTALATLWPVDDRATVALMDAFYDGLAEGLSTDRALQHAQVAYLDGGDGRTSSPFFWAGAVLSGPPSTVPLRDARPPWLVWAGLAALLIAGGLAWRLYSRLRPHD